jgi:polyisoprenoid-binding protein YceI
MVVPWFCLTETCPAGFRCFSSRSDRPLRRRLAPLIALLLLWPGGARAQVTDLAIDPTNTEIGFRGAAFGLINSEGRFTRFTGALSIARDNPARCSLRVQVDVTSLKMSDNAKRRFLLSHGLLDAAQFPQMVYEGRCLAGATGTGMLDGMLTLHGVTLPLRLPVLRQGAAFVARAPVRRAAWGVDGWPLLLSRTVWITVRTRLDILP